MRKMFPDNGEIEPYRPWSPERRALARLKMRAAVLNSFISIKLHDRVRLNEVGKEIYSRWADATAIVVLTECVVRTETLTGVALLWEGTEIPVRIDPAFLEPAPTPADLPAPDNEDETPLRS